QRVSLFQPERVTSTQPRKLKPHRRPTFKQRTPQSLSVNRIAIQLKAIFSGIARARHQAMDRRNFSKGEKKRLDLIEREGRQRLQNLFNQSTFQGQFSIARTNGFLINGSLCLFLYSSQNLFSVPRIYTHP